MGGNRPLEGKTVVVTRPREQAASLADPLAHLGAEVLLAPTIRIVPRPWDDEVAAVVADLREYRLLIFTSVNAVHVFLGYLELPQAALAGLTVAAVGPATASALEERGVTCDVLPDEYVAEGLVAAIQRDGAAPAGTRVLLPAARRHRPVLPDALRAAGALVDVLAVYDTVDAESLELPVARLAAADFVTFTSGSTVRGFVRLVGDALAAAGPRSGPGATVGDVLAGPRLCAIGPATSEVLREFGLTVAVEAPEHTAAGLVEAIAAAAAQLA